MSTSRLSTSHFQVALGASYSFESWRDGDIDSYLALRIMKNWGDFPLRGRSTGFQITETPIMGFSPWVIPQQLVALDDMSET
ncbi:hypothetical protein HER10_EVM0009564 [Colletotrichum scovillei]|uniref:uncharacterized protein n=1 Tax=Colletotrichum scovillei TaxID=1209932 RepID=UPI0015C3BC88|nr:uncharacterized protein HER10_EVM0009564 [Colletotrichum scovillei]KAF4780125.1 hypothetical protein HER10_EVM0009564 [Colletotrichum scovillei]